MSLGSRFYRQKGRVTMDENELMGSMKVSKAVAKMAIPSVISSLVTVVYNMADTFFVGQTGNPLQVAAVSLTNPIFILFMAFANMFGMGGSAAASMALGEKKEKRVKQVSSFITYASLIVGIVFAAILLVGMQPVLQLFGVDADTYELAKGYTTYISYGAPFIIWSAAASFVVRADGASPGSYDRKYDRNRGQYYFRPDIYQWIWYGCSRRSHCNDYWKYNGECILSLVFL